MMKAACRGYWDTVKLLLENGAKREATDGVIVLYRRSSHCHTNIKYIHTYIHETGWKDSCGYCSPIQPRASSAPAPNMDCTGTSRPMIATMPFYVYICI